MSDSSTSSAEDSLLARKSGSTDASSVMSEDASPSSSSGKRLTEYPPSFRVGIDAPTRAFDEDPNWIPDASDPHSLKASEFGYDDSPQYRYSSKWRGPDEDDLRIAELEPGYATFLMTYISYLILIVIGHARDFFGKRTHRQFYSALTERDGYAAVTADFDSFYTRRLKQRLEDCFSRPVTGVAGRTVICYDRMTPDFYWTFKFTGETTQALNISSYNYLGFAQSRGGCADSVEQIIHSHGLSALGQRAGAGTMDLHRDAERLVARFMGVEDAMLFSMGFSTNSTNLPALVGKGSLIISDELNHASIRFGARLSGAFVRQFKHNDMRSLEKLLREVISQGQPRTHRPWHKILVVVEGLYSMEGTLVNLPGIMALKRKYKFHLFVDEAHSVGALGPRGRGVCDYFGIDPTQVDVLMGTLTKSFGSAGGYIAGTHEFISALRTRSHGSVYAEAMPPPVAQQIIAAMGSIMGAECAEVIPSLANSLPPRLLDGSEGLERLRRLAFNARFLSTGLRRLGYLIYGHRDSPIVPLLIFNPGKLPAFSRLLLERYNIAVVVVAYPATPIVSGRARFCVSAAHTFDDLVRLMHAIDDVGGVLGLRYGKRSIDTVEEVAARAVELAASVE